MEVPGRQTIKDENISQGLVCHPCQEDSVTQPAHGYCINCKEYLCETCYKYHRRPKPFKDHVLVDEDIDTYQSEKEFDDNPLPVKEGKNVFDTKCIIHRYEDLKYRCKVHKILVCSVCALTRHKECKNVDYIPEIYESERRCVVEKIEYVEGKVEYILQQGTDALQLAEESYETTLSTLKVQREQISKYFEETENQANDQVLRFRQKSKKQEKETLEMYQKLKSGKELLITAMPGSEIKQYISMRKTEEVVNNINLKLQEVFGRESFTIAYKPQHPLQALGEMVVEQEDRYVGSRKLELLRRIDVAGKKGANGSVTDMAMLSNDRHLLILTDPTNGRLIVISEKYEVTFHQLPSIPWGIAYISDTEIAVSLTQDEQVKIFTVITLRDTVSLRIKTSFKVSGDPFGIRYRKSECSLIIVIGKEQGCNIEYWSLDGKFLRTVASYEYNIDYMTLTVEENILYSSVRKHLVCLLESDGTELKSFQYIDDNMFGPYGIASDALGNIYVCGQKRLRVVSRDGKWEQILAQEDGFAPQSMLFCEKTKVLFVGQARTYKDVLMFQI